MLNHIKAAAVGFCLMMPTSVLAQQAPAFDASQTKAIEEIVRNYLLKNPDILIDVQNELRKKIEAQVAERRKPVLKELYSSASDYSAGKGEVTVVEFFDYNCPHCRTAFSTVQKLLKEKNVRFVFIDVPFFSEPEVIKASIASARQGKYFEYHAALNAQKGRIAEADALRVAKEIGLDLDKLKKDMNSPEVEGVIREHLQLAEVLGVDSTPAFFVGDKVVLGSLAEDLVRAVEDTEKNGCSICANGRKNPS